MFPEVAELLLALEDKFHPLQLATIVVPKLEFVSAQESLVQYVEPVKQLAFTRVLQQVSKVYESLSLRKLKSLASFIPESDIIKFTVAVLKQRLVEAKIDFQNQAIHFGSHAFESAHIRSQLTVLSKRLQEAVGLIAPKPVERVDARKAKLFADMKRHLLDEQKLIAQRRQVIEERKQKAEEEERQRVCRHSHPSHRSAAQLCLYPTTYSPTSRTGSRKGRS